MEDNRAEQIEALEVLTEFNDRLVHNMEIIAGNRLCVDRSMSGIFCCFDVDDRTGISF